jgi:hypothetical protein
MIVMMEKLVEWLAGKPKYSEKKTCPNAALSTRNSTCCPDANPGRRGGKPATNRLSYGTEFANKENRMYPPYIRDCGDQITLKIE